MNIGRQLYMTPEQFGATQVPGFLKIPRSWRGRGVQRHPGEDMLAMMRRLGAR